MSKQCIKCQWPCESDNFYCEVCLGLRQAEKDGISVDYERAWMSREMNQAIKEVNKNIFDNIHVDCFPIRDLNMDGSWPSAAPESSVLDVRFLKESKHRLNKMKSLRARRVVR